MDLWYRINNSIYKKHILLILFVVGLFMFTLPLKFDNQYTGSSNPIYCTGDTSDPMQSFGYKEGAKDCTKGEIIGYYSDLSATKTIQPWILIVRGVGLVLMLSVSVIWLFKFLFWIAHKIALKIQPKK